MHFSFVADPAIRLSAWPSGGMVDASDSKSLARKGIPVRVRGRPPRSLPLLHDRTTKLRQQRAGEGIRVGAEVESGGLLARTVLQRYPIARGNCLCAAD